MKEHAFKQPIHCARPDLGVSFGQDTKACNACQDVVPLGTSDDRWICPRLMRVSVPEPVIQEEEYGEEPAE